MKLYQITMLLFCILNKNLQGMHQEKDYFDQALKYWQTRMEDTSVSCDDVNNALTFSESYIDRLISPGKRVSKKLTNLRKLFIAASLLDLEKYTSSIEERQKKATLITKKLDAWNCHHARSRQIRDYAELNAHEGILLRDPTISKSAIFPAKRSTAKKKPQRSHAMQELNQTSKRGLNYILNESSDNKMAIDYINN